MTLYIVEVKKIIPQKIKMFLSALPYWQMRQYCYCQIFLEVGKFFYNPCQEWKKALTNSLYNPVDKYKKRKKFAISCKKSKGIFLYQG